MTAARSVLVGTAGWTVPGADRALFPDTGTSLERYSARLPVAEINSTFHRSHRPATYERWQAIVPPDFRFAVKLAKTITHQSRLVDCEPLLRTFAEETAPLAARRGPTLIQLPPKLAFEPEVAARFFDQFAALVGGSAVCEPRHPSWFTDDVDALLAERRIARVAADPALSPAAGEPGGWRQLAYFRLHGSPRRYWSAYPPEELARFARGAAAAAARGAECWIIFDNTAGGAALANALSFQDLFARSTA